MVRSRLHLVAVFLLLTAFLMVPRVVLAQRGFARMFDDNVGKLIPIFTYAVMPYPSADVTGQGTHLGVAEQDASLFLPLWQNTTNDLSFTSLLKVRSLRGEAVLPDSLEPLPSSLFDARFGPSYRHRFSNGWVLGGNLLFGSASDRPFDGYRELEFMTNLFLRVPEDDGDAWLGFINYSNNRDFLNNIPIGGFGYWFGSVKWFEGLVGIPLISFTLFPKEQVSLHYTYYPLLNMHADLTYKPQRWLSMFARFVWENERFFRPTPADQRARLFNYEKRVMAGFSLGLARWFQLKLSGGYAFDRYFFEGRSFSDRHQHRIDLAGAPVAKVELTFLMFPQRMPARP